MQSSLANLHTQTCNEHARVGPISDKSGHMLLYTHTHSLDPRIIQKDLNSGCLSLTISAPLPGLNQAQSTSKHPKSLSHPDLSCPWLTCDIHYEADRVFAHAGAGVQAWILGRGITDLQHLLLYHCAVVGAQRAAVFGPGDGPRRRQRAAQLQHLARVHWAQRGLRNLVFVRCVCRANGRRGKGQIGGGRGCTRRRKERWERKKQAIF